MSDHDLDERCVECGVTLIGTSPDDPGNPHPHRWLISCPECPRVVDRRSDLEVTAS